MKTKPSVSRTVLIVLAFLVIQCQALNAQPKEKEYYKMDFAKGMKFIPGDDSVAPFYISNMQVTNKEYILYLIWTGMHNYPEVFFDALPFVSSFKIPEESYRPFADSASFKYYLDHSDSNVARYIFNPWYLNSPVIGVTWEQADKYCQWLSDRYNEYSLIKKKYYYFSTDPQDEINFSTEAFIFRQYEGVVRIPSAFSFGNTELSKGFDYVGYVLRPSFHLPSKAELQITDKFTTLNDCFCSEPRSYEFLKQFYDNYLPSYKGSIFITPEDDDSFYLESDAVEVDLPKVITEWYLDSYLNEEKLSITDIYRNYGYDPVSFSELVKEENSQMITPKNRLGKMPYIILGENNKREFMVEKAPDNGIKGINKDTAYIYDHKSGTVIKNNGDIYTCFRFAVEAIKKQIR